MWEICWRPPFRGSGRIWGGGLSGRTSLSVGAPLPGLAKALETGTFVHRDTVEYNGGPFTGNSER